MPIQSQFLLCFSEKCHVIGAGWVSHPGLVKLSSSLPLASNPRMSVLSPSRSKKPSWVTGVFCAGRREVENVVAVLSVGVSGGVGRFWALVCEKDAGIWIEREGD